MKISNKTRLQLIEKVLSNYNLKISIGKNKNYTLDTLLSHRIIELSFDVIIVYIELYDKIPNISITRSINFIVSQIKVSDTFYIKQKDTILDWLKEYNIPNENSINDTTFDTSKEEALINLCKLFLDSLTFKRDKNGKLVDNEIASDSLLFEKTLQYAAEEAYGKKRISKKLKGIDDIGQSLIADTIIETDSTNKKYLILDAKFYTKSFKKTYDKNECETEEIDKITYKPQDNRSQMCGYINQLVCNKKVSFDNVQGIIVHAVDNKLYEKVKELNHRNMDIGFCHIKLELVNIECSADEIIKQLKNIIRLA